MTVKSGQAITVLFATSNATTGAAEDATVGPAGTLYVDGVPNAAAVTVTNLVTGVYKAALTLPALTAGQVASLRIAATVGVAAEGIVWQDVSDTAIVSDAQAILSNVTYGNSALATLVGAIPTNPYTGTPPTTGDIAGAILATPANKLATDASGRVTPDTVTPAGPDAATIADQVWDETAADHENIGSTGKALNAAGTAADPWSAALPGTYGAGTAGYLIGNLAANVWGYTTRTLTSLSALVASIATAVWAYVTRTLTSSAAATTAAVAGSNLALAITASYAATVTGLTIPTTWIKLWFTVKNDKDSEADTAAILQVLVSNPAAGSTDGVQYVMAGAANVTQRTLGGLTVDQGAGTVAIALDETLTAVLAKGDDLDWDIKCLESGGACTVLTEGHCAIARTVTRATS